MKKIIISLFFALGLLNISNAEQVIDISNTTMPSDAQIMEVIDKFNFDASQKEYLLKETRKQLEEIYAKQQVTIDEGFLNSQIPSYEQQEMAPVGTSIQKEKKYSKHDPLFKKRNYSQRP